MAAMWVLGLIVGAVALFVTQFLFPVGIALVVIVSLLKPRPAAAAGACVAWGAAFLIVLRQAAVNCAAFDRQLNGACAMGDNTPFALVGLLVLALGVLLTSYAAVRARSARV